MLCQCPKLSPLQTRLVASIGALALLALVYWSLSNPHFAYAAELAYDGTGQLRDGEDHNWHRIQDSTLVDDSALEESIANGMVDHAPALKRQTQAVQIRGNNVGTPYNLEPGETTIFEYPNRLLTSNYTDKGVGLPSELSGKRAVHRNAQFDLRKRQGGDAGRTIYISANTCSQPTWSGSDAQGSPPPQLTLYVSTNSGDQSIGPRAGNQSQVAYPFANGFVNASIEEASGDYYMAVAAPDLPAGYNGTWNYRLAVSIDDYYYAAELDEAFLFQVDTDINSALLVSDNLTRENASDPVFQRWMDFGAPFVLFASNSNLTGLMGMESSFCGVQKFVEEHRQIQAKQSDMAGNTTNVQMGLITRGSGHKPKEQFYLNGLNGSSNYHAFLAMDGNSTASGDGVVGGGGKIWAPVAFRTKSDGNCQLMFNLSFCDEVAYAVPANPQNEAMASFEALQAFYENYTTTWYPFFNYTLQQIACNTSSDARYSLAKNCDDCARAYKEWLCAVSIPRCEDYSNPAEHLQIRNVGQSFYNGSMLDDSFLNSNYVPMSKAPTVDGTLAYNQSYISSFATNKSRNGQIDDVIRPGPYKEVLPCEDLCFSLMQSCPASMQFVCPYPGRGLEASYGKRSPDGSVTCSYLGAVYYTNSARDWSVPGLQASWFALASALVLTVVL